PPSRLRRGLGGRQSLGWAWPLQSIHFATKIPAARATPTTSHGFGPPPRFFFGFGREPSCGLDGATVPRPGFWLVGASPLARALIRLGFIFRIKSASSARGSASFAFTPPS